MFFSFFFFEQAHAFLVFFHSAAVAVLFLRWKKEGIFFLLTPEDVADGNVHVAAVQQLDHMEDVGVSPQRRRIPCIYPQVLCSSL